MTALKSNIIVCSFIAFAVIAVGLLDYVTGSEIRILALYFLPLALAGWALGKIGAVLVTVFSTATWIVVLYLSGTHFSKEYMWFVNALTEGLGFLVVSLLVAKLRADITALRKVEREREKLVAQLKHTDRHKDAFIATLSHELRNPLASIVNAANLLGRSNIEQSRIEWASAVIARQTRNMTLLLNDLLDVSRVAENKILLRLSQVELRTVIDAAVESVRPLIERKRHRLEVNIPREVPAIEADALRLEQVLTNLLNNAAKYTEPEGRIELSVALEDNRVFISIRDNGIGLTTDEQQAVFDVFAQTNSSRESAEGGLGIGLALVKGLVELHQGTIRIESEGVGRGSTFIVDLPLAQSVLASTPISLHTRR